MGPLEAPAGVAALLPTAGGPDAGRLAAIRRLPAGEARRSAAGELGVAFLQQLVQALRRTVPESGLLPRSPERQVYEGAFDRAVAEALSAGDPLGLVRQLTGEG